MMVQDLQEMVRDRCWVNEISLILHPDILFIRDGSPDTSGESHLDQRREALDALQLEGKLNTQNTFDLTLTQTCGDTPTMSNCVFLDADFFGGLVASFCSHCTHDVDKSTD